MMTEKTMVVVDDDDDDDDKDDGFCLLEKPNPSFKKKEIHQNLILEMMGQ